MGEKDHPKPVGETERSFKPGEAGGYQADTFSRGDAEGVPADDTGAPDEVVEDERVLRSGEAGGYQTDALSRGDAEGVPQEDLHARPRKADGASPAEAPPEGAHRKATDDADSRDAPPMADPSEGGVR